jgi:hypothetical protein
MINFLIENKDVREELLKWVELRKVIIWEMNVYHKKEYLLIVF